MKLPTELIFFVTSVCNLRCRHCFNWRNLNRRGDLELPEIECLAGSLPSLRYLYLSGGEPFTRSDLAATVSCFVERCPLVLVDIPTNGWLVDRVVEETKRILAIPRCPPLSISVSLDGLKETHDANRGVSGSFDRAVACCEGLLDLKTRTKGLAVNVITTLTAENEDEVLKLSRFVERKLHGVDEFYWGLLRGMPAAHGTCAPTLNQVMRVDATLMAQKRKLKGAQAVMVEELLYDLRRLTLRRREQPVPCVAGDAISVVYDNGDVAPCELLPPAGNLRERTFAEIWNSEEMQTARCGILKGSCACTHECFLYPSMIAYVRRHPALAAWRFRSLAALSIGRRLRRELQNG